MDRLIAHPWPGNVRELRNVIERAAILFPGRTVSAEEVDLLLHRRTRVDRAERAAVWEASERAVPLPVMPMPVPEPATAGDDTLINDGPVDLRTVVAELEHRYISAALDRTEGVVAVAARSLSLPRPTLLQKLGRKHVVEGNREST